MQSPLFLAAIFFLVFAGQPLLGQNAPATAGQPTPQAQSGARPRRPQPKPVNLKVLPKDIAREDLIRIMRGYAGLLGVECSFCHARNPQTHKLDFPSDAKDDKTIARTMILMTQTINEQYMTQVHDPDAMPEDKHVTCGTCHRGHSMPEHFVPPAEPRNRGSDDEEGARSPQ
jgi:photosynthetic reaction center cytochrome c subunit